MKIKLTTYVHFVQYDWEKEGQFITLNHHYQHDDVYTLVNVQEVEIEVPDNYNPVADKIAALKNRQVQALADYNRTAAEIHERISKLQALEYVA